MADKLSTAHIASLERGASDINSVGYADGIWSVPAAASPAGGRGSLTVRWWGFASPIRCPVLLATEALCSIEWGPSCSGCGSASVIAAQAQLIVLPNQISLREKLDNGDHLSVFNLYPLTIG